MSLIIIAVSTVVLVFALTLAYLKRKKAARAQQDLLRETHKKQQNQEVIAPAQEIPVNEPVVIITETMSEEIAEAIVEEIVEIPVAQIPDEVVESQESPVVEAEPDEVIVEEIIAEEAIEEVAPVSATEVIPTATDEAESVVADVPTEVEEKTEAEYEENAEESLLKRHHLSQVRMMLANTSFPRPSDNALSRHYDTMIEDEAEKCLADEQRMERLLQAYENYRKSQIIPDVNVTETSEKKSPLPQDSALRRHHIAQLRATIEMSKFPRPTDFMLRRHYDAMIEAEVAKQLECD
jgi:hypothetical protein